MRRIAVPQLVAQPWYPAVLKTCMAEFLTWFVDRVGAARPFVPYLEAALDRVPSAQLVDLQGTTGAGLQCVLPHLDRTVAVEPVTDALSLPTRTAVYSFVNVLHQLEPDEAVAALATAARARQPVVVVEGNNDNWWQAVGMLLFVPLSVLLSAPLVRPFRWSRLLFTYLVPVLPLATSYDGVAALFRLYDPDALLTLARRTGAPDDYVWDAGRAPNGRGGKILYLIGHAGSARQTTHTGSLSRSLATDRAP
jgi:hypothetical protein